MSVFEATFAAKVEQVNTFISRYWIKEGGAGPGIADLVESIRYSASSGGKRFRPVLALLTAQALKHDENAVLPYAACVEFVHTYSLIHDDLPCMDNDDMRRGLPTNHKVYGEAVALLAGDALLTEAFNLIASHYESKAFGLKLVRILSEAAGVRGMVGGQATDMIAKAETLTRSELEVMHHMKTGVLITSAVEGASLICGATLEQAEALKGFAQRLGLAFQVADDVLDSTEETLEPGSFPALIGLQETRAFLEELTREALSMLNGFGAEADGLRWIANFNLTRAH